MTRRKTAPEILRLDARQEHERLQRQRRIGRAGREICRAGSRRRRPRSGRTSIGRSVDRQDNAGRRSAGSSTAASWPATRVDPVVFRALLRVFHMLDVPEQRMFNPEIVLRSIPVLARVLRGDVPPQQFPPTERDHVLAKLDDRTGRASARPSDSPRRIAPAVGSRRDLKNGVVVVVPRAEKKGATS
jgi:hypothetical protein